MQGGLASHRRPPIVVVMGHIDHGKSTLLDYIRKANTVSKEAGGITQHLGAYMVHHTTSEGVKIDITFLDTPGHEAFQAIRSRGATVADVAILVVSAEDGVKKQTLEALGAIKSAGIPYIVAINKIDKPTANIEKTKQSLAENEVYVEGYGGDIPVVPVSAVSGQGIPDLLDMIHLVSELENLECDSEQLAHGSVIETHVDKRTGICATLIILDGTLRTGMFVVAENASAPVRAMLGSDGKNVKEAGASVPVLISGFSELPEVGATFKAFANRKAAENYMETKASERQRPANRIAEDTSGKPYVPLIVKADTTGSLEGILHQLNKTTHEDINLKIISSGVGPVNESDAKLTLSAQGAIIVAFHVEVDSKAQAIIDRSGITVEKADVIYHIQERLVEILEERRPRKTIETKLGVLKVLATFSRAKDKQILGGKVTEGIITTGSTVKIMRRGALLGEGKIRELQQQKARASEVREGFECGLMIDTKYEVAVGDTLEAFEQKII